MKPCRRSAPAHRATAFTLIETLVVVAIVAILCALVAPSLRNALESARAVVCANALKQIHAVYAFYLNDNRDWFMPYSQGGDFPDDGYATGKYPNMMMLMQGYYRGLPPKNWGDGAMVDFFRCPSSTVPESGRKDIRNVDYHAVVTVWQNANGRHNRYGPNGDYALKHCLAPRDVKRPSKVPLMGDCNGRFARGLTYVTLLNEVVTMGPDEREPGMTYWSGGAPGQIFLRHGARDAYNLFYADGHVFHHRYPDCPMGMEGIWLRTQP